MWPAVCQQLRPQEAHARAHLGQAVLLQDEGLRQKLHTSLLVAQTHPYAWDAAASGLRGRQCGDRMWQRGQHTHQAGDRLGGRQLSSAANASCRIYIDLFVKQFGVVLRQYIKKLIHRIATRLYCLDTSESIFWTPHTCRHTSISFVQSVQSLHAYESIVSDESSRRRQLNRLPIQQSTQRLSAYGPHAQLVHSVVHLAVFVVLLLFHVFVKFHLHTASEFIRLHCRGNSTQAEQRLGAQFECTQCRDHSRSIPEHGRQCQRKYIEFERMVHVLVPNA